MSEAMHRSEELSAELLELRRSVEALREQFSGAQAATVVACEARVAQLQRDMDVMTQAAIERERDYSRREAEWSQRVLNATATAQTSRMQAEHLAEKLAAADARLKQLLEQTAQYDGMMRAHGAKIAGMEGAAQRLGEMEAERDVLRARVAELAGARSRRLLLKLGLVGRCGWEQ